MRTWEEKTIIIVTMRTPTATYCHVDVAVTPVEFISFPCCATSTHAFCGANERRKSRWMVLLSLVLRVVSGLRGDTFRCLN